ncbi:MAG: AAA family ATPase [Eubacteriaceae bacterium]|nr:AAA family ATPase [Eubacteriaceae bacterium]
MILTLFNQKGGVGKTTSAANISAALAEAGKKVLALDFDPQSNLSSGLGIQRKGLKRTIYSVLIGNSDINSAIVETTINGLDLIPASIDLAGSEIEMASEYQRETILKRALSGLAKTYDYIVIDCPPSLGLLPINALAACDGVLIPIQCEYYALEGVSQLINTVNLVKRSINPYLEITGVIMTMYDSRTNLSQLVYEEVRNYFGVKVFETIIPRNVRLAEAPSHGQVISQYDPKSKGAIAYASLVKELISRTSMQEAM